MVDGKKIGLVLLCFAAGLTGGFISNSFFKAAPSYAQTDSTPQVLTAEEFQLVDHSGKTTARWTTCENSPCLNLYDSAGNVRLQVGLYSDGLPFIGLFDKSFEAKGLFRLAGANESPVLVIKNNGQDRIIMGMDLINSTEPFLVYFDKDGQKHLQFGNY